MKPKIYICGPITGLPNGNKKAFLKAEKKLKKLNYKPINPRRLVGKTEGKLEKEYDYYALKKSLQLFLKTNIIYVLKGWVKSKGAVIEHNLALDMNYEIYYEEGKYGKQL